MVAGKGIRPYPAFRLFFPAAVLFAAGSVPAWALGRSGAWAAPWLPPSAFWHGHEMVFGYALAVVGGYLFTRITARQAAIALAAWGAGRVVMLVPAVPAVLAAAVGLLYPLCLLLFAAGPLLRAAKRWDSAALGVVVGGFLVAEGIYALGRLGVVAGGEQRGLMLGVDLIAFLLFAMGGRIVAAATSGAVQRRGGYIEQIAQPRLQRAALVLLAAMTTLDAFGAVTQVAGLAATTVGIVAILRLCKWRFWTLIATPEIALLHLGYGWLAAGLLLKGTAQLFPALPPADALHGLTVGALGTLTVVMMSRTILQKRRLPMRMPAPVLAAAALLSSAAVLRLLAPATDGRWLVIDAAALLWASAFAAFALFLLPAVLSRR